MILINFPPAGRLFLLGVSFATASIIETSRLGDLARGQWSANAN
jgi:hypothetical protein